MYLKSFMTEKWAHLSDATNTTVGGGLTMSEARVAAAVNSVMFSRNMGASSPRITRKDQYKAHFQIGVLFYYHELNSITAWINNYIQ